jgi:starch synthase
MPYTLKILFLAAEAEPYVKIGGLADVAGSLPLALRNLPAKAAQGVELDVRLVLPLHRAIRAGLVPMCLAAEFFILRAGEKVPVKVFETTTGGMPVYFIDGEPIASAAKVYSLDPAFDREKFTFFSLAALELVRRLDWKPDILHANDWHTALSIYALRSHRKDPAYKNLCSVLTLHNLTYMGGDGTDVLVAYGMLPPDDDVLPLWARTQPLPLGLWAADAVVPVSPSYAREIQTPDYGCGLDGFLRNRSDSITGILNGLDVAAWDPETDQGLAATFGVEDLIQRAQNKTALQKHLGLKMESRLPVLATIGRMDTQKGLDITIDALHQLSGHAFQFVRPSKMLPGLCSLSTLNLSGQLLVTMHP